MTKLKEIAEQMNDLGKQGKSFVFLIDFEMKKPMIFESENSLKKIKFKFPESSNHNQSFVKIPLKVWKIKPVSFDTYKFGFDLVKKHINGGDSYLLNYTQPTAVETNLSLEEIYHLSTARYKVFLKDKFVCFSPETFIKIKSGKIFSFPMKGTIDAEIENARELILNDSKEIAEHNTIVDLIRNDLSLISENVTVDKFRYLDLVKTHQKNLWQVSSQISGKLPENYTDKLGDIIFTMLPAGSISGAPKKKTLEIIKNAENYERGFYSGIFGVFDGKNLDSCVLIRYIENQNGQLLYKSGGGITFMSEAEKEYEEMLKKYMSQLLETIKCKNGKLENLTFHNLRFNNARRNYFGLSEETNLEEIIKIPENCKLGLFRCRVIYTAEIEKIEFLPYHYKKVKSLKLVISNNIDYHLKFADRNSLLNLFEKRGDCDDILIVKNHCITDSFTANPVFFDGKKWWTPNTPLLPGTQRARLLKEKKIFECRITPDDLKKFKKAGLINALQNLKEMPVIDITNIHF